MLKAELARAGMGYKVLAARLEDIGVADTPGAIASRVSRGKFSFAFFLQCMSVLHVNCIRLRERTDRN